MQTMSDRDGLIWMDGEMVDWREAKTHVLTHTLHYGMGVFEGVRAYKAGAHRHGPEIEQELSRLAGAPIRIAFVPHLVPMSRGILATCYARPSADGVTAVACTDAARALYAGSPSVAVLDEGQHPDTLWVRGSNRVHVAYTQDPRSGTLIAMSAIDNLVKGASGQAIQCLNVRFGLEEGTGLGATATWP